MGLGYRYTNFIQRSIGDVDYKTIQMCELGDQVVGQRSGSMKKHLKEIGTALSDIKTGKDYYQFLGIGKHVSIDTNGKHGALKIDLCKEIQDKKLIGAFDVLTNSGTSEHVKESYPCFLNIHNLVKPGGIMIHIVPKTGHWKGHGTWKYDMDFFDELCRVCEYEVVLKEFMASPRNELVAYSMRKTDREFVSQQEWNTLPHRKK